MCPHPLLSFLTRERHVHEVVAKNSSGNEIQLSVVSIEYGFTKWFCTQEEENSSCFCGISCIMTYFKTSASITFCEDDVPWEAFGIIDIVSILPSQYEEKDILFNHNKSLFLDIARKGYG
jgi:hypothetical protein